MGIRKEQSERMEKDEEERRNVKTNLMITFCVNHFSFIYRFAIRVGKSDDVGKGEALLKCAFMDQGF